MIRRPTSKNQGLWAMLSYTIAVSPSLFHAVKSYKWRIPTVLTLIIGYLPMSSALDLSLGAILIGTYLSSVLFGVTSVQLYVYLLSGYKDTICTRVLVWVCWIMEFLWTIAIWIYPYRIMVTFYGDLSALTTPHWTLSVSSAFNAIIGALVQAYFANRVRILSGGRILPLVALTGALTQATATLVITGLSLHHSVGELSKRFGWISTLAIAAGLATDALNTAGLWYYLRAQNAAVLTTRKAIAQLLSWTLQTGFLLTAAALLMLIFNVALPETELWIAVSLFYGKLYSNSFMASLNGRKHLRRGATKDELPYIPSSAIDIHTSRGKVIEMNKMSGLDRRGDGYSGSGKDTIVDMSDT